MSRKSLAWAAGLFEGEGSFAPVRMYVTKSGKFKSPRMTASLGMRDKDIVDRFAEVVGVGAVNRKPPDMWQWQVGSFEGVQAVMAFLWKWLGARRRAKVIELLTMVKQWRGLCACNHVSGAHDVSCPVTALIKQEKARAASKI